MIRLTLGLTRHRTAGHYGGEDHYAEVFAVSASFKTDDPPLWGGLVSPSTRADALRLKTGGFASTATKITTPSSIVGTPSINASGCSNPELGQLGDDDAYRRWQARTVCYTAETANLLTRTATTNIVAIIQANREGTTRTRAR